jgi:hypothetical protein
MTIQDTIEKIKILRDGYLDLKTPLSEDVFLEFLLEIEKQKITQSNLAWALNKITSMLPKK